ncbi:MAG: SspB family protein [Rhodospirillaceae bacterium]
MTDQIDILSYGEMVDEALRGVVREALRVTQDQGNLPGEHHFFITFRTDDPDVVLPKRLAEQHPDQMTIVLQRQFWDLEVTEEMFSVTLSFGGVREHLSIPYQAVTAFADPHANFGLQFNTLVSDSVSDEVDDGDLEELRSELDAVEAEARSREEGTQDQDTDSGQDQDAETPEPESDSKVVALDAFRKKT